MSTTFYNVSFVCSTHLSFKSLRYIFSSCIFLLFFSRNGSQFCRQYFPDPTTKFFKHYLMCTTFFNRNYCLQHQFASVGKKNSEPTLIEQFFSMLGVIHISADARQGGGWKILSAQRQLGEGVWQKCQLTKCKEQEDEMRKKNKIENVN